jgi:tRNA threonylcarbamoyladenosine biosynthesis protein TsaE
MEPRTIDSAGPDQTRELGEALGRVARPGDLIALVGNLGAGKTLLVQALARGLGVPAEVAVVSPTFTLINEYDGGRTRLYHADLYRIEKEIELDELGLDEMCRRGDGVVVVEWADRFRVFPRDHLTVTIEVTGDDDRQLTVTAGGDDSARLLVDWLG